jgi:hypothetical protein
MSECCFIGPTGLPHSCGGKAIAEDPSVTEWRDIMDTRVHNHGPDKGRGLDCPEARLLDGRLRGACMDKPAEATPFIDREFKSFVTKDSGQRVDYPSGMRRDVADNKARFDLIPLPMLRRLAELYGRGAVKYGDNNWQLADSEEELQRFKASAFRHFIQWLEGDREEDHGAAVFFNITAAEHVLTKLEGR